MAAYEIVVDTYQALRYDLQAAIDKYIADLEAHASTVGEPAPGTTALVETIVKSYGGLFVIVPSPTAPERQPLPKDAKYYKSLADRTAVEEYIARTNTK